jgi:hypothetical protein
MVPSLCWSDRNRGLSPGFLLFIGPSVLYSLQLTRRVLGTTNRVTTEAREALKKGYVRFPFP